MANLHLVTGYAGQEHVTSADQGSWNAAVMGTGQFVMGKGNQFAASVVSNNQIRILDGEIMMQGRYIRLEPNTFVDLAIENGTQGYKRNDLVVARYTKTASSGVEEVNLVVIKGENAASSPVDPEYISGNILEGAIQNDLPLYRVPLDGLTVGELVPLFDVIGTTLEGLQKEIMEGFEEYKNNLDERLEGHTHSGETISVSPGISKMFGLSGNENVDSVLSYLGQYNMHWWKTFVDTSMWNEIRTFNSAQYIAISGSGVSTLYISDAISIDQSSGTITQVNPTQVTANIYFGSTADAIAAGEQLRGKYLLKTDSWANTTLVYMPTDATFYAHNYGDSRYGCGTQTGTYDITSEYQTGGTTDYLSSTDRNACPDSGIVNGVEYTYLGIPFDNAITASKINVVTGQYSGYNNGAKHGDYPVEVNLGKMPDLVILSAYGTLAISDQPSNSYQYHGVFLPSSTHQVIFTDTGFTASGIMAQVARSPYNYAAFFLT